MKDEERFAKIIADTINWASARAESPAIINAQCRGDEVRFTGVPGRTYRFIVRPAE